jgi:hypothetical protein
MKNSIIMAVVVMSVLFLAGCTGGGNQSSSTAPFVGGTSGLVVSFVDNAPPAMVTDTDFPFNIIVNLENAGEFSIPVGGVAVTINGMNPADFGSGASGAITGTNGLPLTGMSRDFSGNVIQGAQDQVTLPAQGLTYNFARQGKLTGSLEIPLSASVCYAYKTTASGSFCIKKDTISNVPGICEATGAQTIYSSGAPVQVTALTESSAGKGSVMLSFTIAHRSNGYVFTRNPKATAGAAAAIPCNEANIPEQNRLTATVTVPNAVVTCYGLGTGGSTGEIILGTGGQTTVTCKVTGLAAVDAVGEVSIALEYYYLEKKSAGTLSVRHVATS